MRMVWPADQSSGLKPFFGNPLVRIRQVALLVGMYLSLISMIKIYEHIFGAYIFQFFEIWEKANQSVDT